MFCLANSPIDSKLYLYYNGSQTSKAKSEGNKQMMLLYIDPSVMSYTVQAIAGVAIALGVVFGVVWRKVRRGANKALGRDENAGKEVEEDVKEM